MPAQAMRPFMHAGPHGMWAKNREVWASDMSPSRTFRYSHMWSTAVPSAMPDSHELRAYRPFRGTIAMHRAIPAL